MKNTWIFAREFHPHKSVSASGLQYGWVVSFAMGIILGCCLPSPILEVSVGCIGFGVCAFRTHPEKWILWYLGFGILWVHHHAYLRGVCFSEVERVIQVQGYVTRLTPVRYGYGVEVAHQAQFWYHGLRPIHLGDWIQAEAYVRPLKVRTHPQAYDARWSAFWSGIFQQGSLQRITQVHPPFTLSWGQRIHQRLDAGVAQFHNSNLGQIFSKLIRASGRISPSIRLDFAQSGLSHLLAVSGLHMTIVGGFVFALCRHLLLIVSPWGLHSSLQSVAALGTLPFLWLYAWQCWEAVSARRALIMSSGVLLARMLQRPALGLRSCMLAGMGILLLNPEALFSVSFQMSFMAVLMIAHHQNLQQWKFRSKRSWMRSCIQNLALTFRLSSITTLYATQLPDAGTFGLGVISNLWAIPYVTLVVMPLCFMHYIGLCIGFDGLGWLCENSLSLCVEMAYWGRKITEFGALQIPPLSSLTLLLFTVSVLWAVLCATPERRWNRWGILAALLSIWIPWQPSLDPIAPVYHRVCMKKGPHKEPLA